MNRLTEGYIMSGLGLRLRLTPIFGLGSHGEPEDGVLSPERGTMDSETLIRDLGLVPRAPEISTEIASELKDEFHKLAGQDLNWLEGVDDLDIDFGGVLLSEHSMDHVSELKDRKSMRLLNRMAAVAAATYPGIVSDAAILYDDGTTSLAELLQPSLSPMKEKIFTRPDGSTMQTCHIYDRLSSSGKFSISNGSYPDYLRAIAARNGMELIQPELSGSDMESPDSVMVFSKVSNMAIWNKARGVLERKYPLASNIVWMRMIANGDSSNPGLNVSKPCGTMKCPLALTRVLRRRDSVSDVALFGEPVEADFLPGMFSSLCVFTI